MKREYTAVFKKKGKWIAAWVEEIPGVNTQGKTMKEARENLRDALGLVLEENKRFAAEEYPNSQREILVVVSA
jgi:predicted RNase H-like HicB family nuclease